jgi:hypothetical protein
MSLGGPVNVSNSKEHPVNASVVIDVNNATGDGFGRLRVSNPETLFDSKNIFDDGGIANTAENQPLFYDNQETSGSGTSTAYRPNESSQALTVGATTAGTRIRQTKQRFNYQPGKSMLVMMTFTFPSQSSGITVREGMFDDNNGLYLEDTGSVYNFVRRTFTSGAAVNNSVARSSWNIDTMDGKGKSGINLDFTKTTILVIDYEWLGVGRVRMGFNVDGVTHYAHQFLNANNLSVVYMQTPNLPLRSEITNDGTGVASTLIQICSTVISEGSQHPLGLSRYASTNGTHLATTTENTIYALLGIRLKSAYIGNNIIFNHAAMQVQTASEKLEWILILNPTVADTFAYADETNSAVQVARGATANTVTGGIYLDGGYIESGNNASGASGSTEGVIGSAYKLGSLIDGTVDEVVLCVRPIGGSAAVNIEGSLHWQELT